MMRITRRNFLKTSLLTTAGLSLPARAWAAVPGANDTIRVAVVGFGGRGGSHISAFSEMKGARVVALCDADRKILDHAAKRLSDKGSPVATYTDIRELLESKDVDVVSTATPNHWHSLITVWSCQAGKDVYVEKPVSHNVWEGRKCVEAARKYNRIVQTGTQSRSDGRLHEAFAWLREGHLGKIQVARGLCYKPRGSIGQVAGPQPVPPDVDYDLWCGPALKLPLMRKKLHYDWHWVWNTGNGDIGNQGIHQMDIARWALGKMELAPKVFSIGGRLGYVDDGETPNTQMAVFDYGEALLIFEVRGLPEKTGAKNMDIYRGESIGHVIECEGGYIAGTAAYDRDGALIKKFSGGGHKKSEHFENFIEAVRTRKKEDLTADILEGHLSSALCHLGNISYRLGQTAEPQALRDLLRNDHAAQETLARMEPHLAANGVDLKTSQLTIGPTLRFDPKAERFLDHSRANELLTRPYRKPFVVPNEV
jgi:predicted dehydrogenase